MSNIGILAFGSVMSDPGKEICPLIVCRIPTETPFPIEFVRLSSKRGDAPTVAPHSSGNPVKAEVLVLSDSVQIEEAKSLLWRRETRKEHSGKRYHKSSSPDAVLICDAPGFCGLGHVLYTDFNLDGKLENPDPHSLACAAIRSVSKASPGQDGISYLMNLIDWGVETSLTRQYENEILTMTGTDSLAEAYELINSRTMSKSQRR